MRLAFYDTVVMVQPNLSELPLKCAWVCENRAGQYNDTSCLTKKECVILEGLLQAQYQGAQTSVPHRR